MDVSEEHHLRRRFGRELRRQRGERSQQDLAQAMSVSASYVALVETGRRRASDEFLESFASVVESDAEELKKQRDLVDSLGRLQGLSPSLQDEILSLVGHRLQRAPSGQNLRESRSRQMSLGLMSSTNAMAFARGWEKPRRGRKPRRESLLEELVEKASSLNDRQLERAVAYLDGLSDSAPKPGAGPADPAPKRPPAR